VGGQQRGEVEHRGRYGHVSGVPGEDGASVEFGDPLDQGCADGPGSGDQRESAGDGRIHEAPPAGVRTAVVGADPKMRVLAAVARAACWRPGTPRRFHMKITW